MVFDITHDGYHIYPIFIGLLAFLFFSFLLYIAIKQHSKRWTTRLTISLIICFLWLSGVTILTYNDYNKAETFSQSSSISMVEGYIIPYENTYSNKNNCNGFSIQQTLFCYSDNPYFLNGRTATYIKPHIWARIMYADDVPEQDTPIIIRMYVIST